MSLALLVVLVAGADGCAHEVVLDGRRFSGGPVQHCIREVLRVQVADEEVIAVRVDAPHRFEARVRSRVFVYRLEGQRLEPRFLGSGFSAREVTGLFALEGALGVETRSADGATERLRCVFEGFPLVCVPLR